MRRSPHSPRATPAANVSRHLRVRRATVLLLTSSGLAIGLIASPMASARPQPTGSAAPEPAHKRQREAASVASAGPGGGASSGTPASEPLGTVTPSEPSPPSAVARSQRAGKCLLSIEANSARITAGETVTVFGAVTCPGGADVSGRAVTIYESERGTGVAGSSEVATTTTNANGAYKVTPPAFGADMVFYARSAGARGAHALVRVAPKVTLLGPAPGVQMLTRGEHLGARAHNRITFTGTVSPADGGALVTLQREYAASGEQWRPVAFGRVGLDGHYSITHGFTSPGLASVRVVVHPTGPKLVAASEPLSYEIGQAQNPKLTIQTTADPISYGQTVNITGVAAGPAQLLTLQARSAAGGFVEVAHEMTGAGGKYEFPERPLRSTSYRVIDAAATSTELFEGVEYALAAGTAPETAQTGEQLSFVGSVVPASAGQVVLLEREGLAGINFQVVESATVSADSSYSIPYTFYHACTCVMRVKVPADSEHRASTSQPFSIRVTPALSAGLEPSEPTGAVSVEK
jgi:hypothetical protein